MEQASLESLKSNFAKAAEEAAKREESLAALRAASVDLELLVSLCSHLLAADDDDF